LASELIDGTKRAQRGDVIPLVAEVFRELGYEGASLNEITERTGIGKGSLYHFFPGGKELMVVEVLDHVDRWFVENVFEPLERKNHATASRTWGDEGAPGPPKPKFRLCVSKAVL